MIFLFPETSKPALGTNLPLVHWVPVFYPGSKAAVDYSRSSIADAEEWQKLLIYCPVDLHGMQTESFAILSFLNNYESVFRTCDNGVTVIAAAPDSEGH